MLAYFHQLPGISPLQNHEVRFSPIETSSYVSKFISPKYLKLVSAISIIGLSLFASYLCFKRYLYRIRSVTIEKTNGDTINLEVRRMKDNSDEDIAVSDIQPYTINDIARRFEYFPANQTNIKWALAENRRLDNREEGREEENYTEAHPENSQTSGDSNELVTIRSTGYLCNDRVINAEMITIITTHQNGRYVMWRVPLNIALVQDMVNKMEERFRMVSINDPEDKSYAEKNLRLLKNIVSSSYPGHSVTYI